MARSAWTSADDADTIMGTGHGITSDGMPVQKTNVACPSLCWEKRFPNTGDGHLPGARVRSARRLIAGNDPSESTETAGDHFLKNDRQ